MSILVFGKTGQVARELAALAPEASFVGRDTVDLAEPMDCIACIESAHPDAVINAAAWTEVDEAEDHRVAAFKVNGNAPSAMATVAARLDIPIVHISTDYVFDGSGDAPWRPDDIPAPLGVYGASKRAGEVGIIASGAAHAILRTSWVFSAHGENFVKTMLALGRTRNQLNVVSDQIGGPTPAAAIAAAALTMADALIADPSRSGIYHFSGAPDASWADFARAIFRTSRQDVTVTDVPSTVFPRPAPRPKNSRLDCTSIEETFGITRPDWQAALARVLSDLESQVT